MPLLLLLAALAACAAVPRNGSEDAAGAADGAVLARSVPAEGAAVRSPRGLSLTFREPLRLVEVIVAGPSGEMPMMVSAAGEQKSYFLPLPELEPGRHEVRWRAVAPGGGAYSGSLSFTVR